MRRQENKNDPILVLQKLSLNAVAFGIRNGIQTKKLLTSVPVMLFEILNYFIKSVLACVLLVCLD